TPHTLTNNPTCASQFPLTAGNNIVVCILLERCAIMVAIPGVVIRGPFKYLLSMPVENHQLTVTEQFRVGPLPVSVDAVAIGREDAWQFHRGDGQRVHPDRDHILGLHILVVGDGELKPVGTLSQVADLSTAVRTYLDRCAFGT